MKWPVQALQVGDVVEILPNDGVSDRPIEVKESSDAPNHLFSNAELAKEVFDTVQEIYWPPPKNWRSGSFELSGLAYVGEYSPFF
jgi:hypothetical protein